MIEFLVKHQLVYGPSFSPYDFLGLGIAMMFFMLLLFLGLYIYMAYALMTIAQKTKTKDSWLAWIPIANLYLMTQIAKVEWWTFLIVLVAGLIPFGFLVSSGIMIWWWRNIAKRRNKPGWISLLLLIPIVNLIVMGIIAWSD